MKAGCVIENTTLSNLYEAHLMLEGQNLSELVCRELRLNTPKPDLKECFLGQGQIQLLPMLIKT